MKFDAVTIDRRVRLWKFFLVLALLSIVDYELTRRWIYIAGIDGEFNPLLRRIISEYGIHAILFMKAGFLTLLGLGIAFMRAKYMSHLQFVMWALIAFQAFAVAVGIYCHTLT